MPPARAGREGDPDYSLMTKGEAARALLLSLFANRKRVLFREIEEAGAAIGLQKRLLQRMRHELGISRVYTGPGKLGFWEWDR